MTEPSRVHHLLDLAAERWPDAPYLRHQGRVLTFGQAQAWSLRVAAWLRAQGVRPGDRLTLALPNQPLVAALVFAASRLGAVWCVLHPEARPARLQAMVADAAPALIVSDGPALAVLATPGRPVVSTVNAIQGIASTPAADDLTDGVPVNDLAGLVYTSGSTSQPKGVMVTHRNVTFTSGAIQQVLGLRPGDTIGLALPLAFDYGLYQLFLACCSGAAVALGGEVEAGVDWPQRLVAHGVTVLPLVPHQAAMLLALLRRTGAPRLPHLRMLTSTGEAFPEVWLDAARVLLPETAVYVMYGLTECKRVSIRPRGTGSPGSAGLPLPGTQVRVLDPAGRPLPVGAAGQIAVQGQHVTAGYWRAPELTAARFVPDAVGAGVTLLTGDEGYLDADGHLHVLGRSDGLYKWLGVRISTAEVEAAAAAVPGVDEAVVLPPQEGRGAWLAVTGDVTAQAVAAGLRPLLEDVRMPAAITVVPVIPKLLTGKADRAALLRLLLETEAPD